jgi:predicted O-linked N-acetylglucosamine transferase (SPINDLY family)
MTELDRGDDSGLDRAGAEFERAMALFRAGHAAEAETLCRATLDRHPDYPRALQLLGLIRFTAGDVGSAIDLLKRVVSLKPDDATAEFNLGAALAATGSLAEAVVHYRRTIELRPGLTEAHTSLGAVLEKLDRLAEAEAALRQALAISPDEPLALANLASVLFAQGRIDDATTTARRAAERAPDLMPAHLQLGRALAACGDFASATAHLRRACELAPDAPQPATLLIHALYDCRALDEAEAVGRDATRRFPDSAAAAGNLAAVKVAQGEVNAGIELYRRAVRLDPSRPLYHRNLLSSLLYAPDLPLAERYEAHLAFGRAMAARVKRPLPPVTRRCSPGRKLRIGWLSSDFRNHPVTVNLGLLLSCRDRSRFEYVAYADVLNPDSLTELVRSDMDLWRSIVGMSDEAAAARIREDQIDIMIYLAGRFDANRPQVAAWRPAPIQVSFHDPATSGLAEMDYLIADPVLAPRNGSEGFIERVVRLPSFYSHPPFDSAPILGPPPMDAAGYVTFGSFNNPAKINERVLALWGELLRRIPGARLLFKYRQLFANKALRDRFLRGLGLSGDRVQFALEPDETVEDHLRAYERVDVALDTFPFNGSTTTFEALWMGLPVVTLAGEAMAGRWSASILHALKLGELVARRPGDYLDIAAGLAADPARLAAWRAGLREQIRRSPLCNGPLRARQIERLFDALWRHAGGSAEGGTHEPVR